MLIRFVFLKSSVCWNPQWRLFNLKDCYDALNYLGFGSDFGFFLKTVSADSAAVVLGADSSHRMRTWKYPYHKNILSVLNMTEHAFSVVFYNSLNSIKLVLLN